MSSCACTNDRAESSGNALQFFISPWKKKYIPSCYPKNIQYHDRQATLSSDFLMSSHPRKGTSTKRRLKQRLVEVPASVAVAGNNVNNVSTLTLTANPDFGIVFTDDTSRSVHSIDCPQSVDPLYVKTEAGLCDCHQLASDSAYALNDCVELGELQDLETRLHQPSLETLTLPSTGISRPDDVSGETSLQSLINDHDPLQSDAKDECTGAQANVTLVTSPASPSPFEIGQICRGTTTQIPSSDTTTGGVLTVNNTLTAIQVPSLVRYSEIVPITSSASQPNAMPRSQNTFIASPVPRSFSSSEIVQTASSPSNSKAAPRSYNKAKKHQCPICNTLMSQADLPEHIKSHEISSIVHSQRSRRNGTADGFSKTFSCPKCSFKTTNTTELSEHLEQHEDEETGRNNTMWHSPNSSQLPTVPSSSGPLRYRFPVIGKTTNNNVSSNVSLNSVPVSLTTSSTAMPSQGTFGCQQHIHSQTVHPRLWNTGQNATSSTSAYPPATKQPQSVFPGCSSVGTNPSIPTVLPLTHSDANVNFHISCSAPVSQKSPAQTIDMDFPTLLRNMSQSSGTSATFITQQLRPYQFTGRPVSNLSQTVHFTNDLRRTVICESNAVTQSTGNQLSAQAQESREKEVGVSPSTHWVNQETRSRREGEARASRETNSTNCIFVQSRVVSTNPIEGASQGINSTNLLEPHVGNTNSIPRPFRGTNSSDCILVEARVGNAHPIPSIPQSSDLSVSSCEKSNFGNSISAFSRSPSIKETAAMEARIEHPNRISSADVEPTSTTNASGGDNTLPNIPHAVVSSSISVEAFSESTNPTISQNKTPIITNVEVVPECMISNQIVNKINSIPAASVNSSESIDVTRSTSNPEIVVPNEAGTSSRLRKRASETPVMVNASSSDDSDDSCEPGASRQKRTSSKNSSDCSLSEADEWMEIDPFYVPPPREKLALKTPASVLDAIPSFEAWDRTKFIAEDSDPDTPRPENDCYVCALKFDSHELLKEHRVKRYSDLKCCKCHFKAATAKRLKSHTNRHTGPKPYACQECPVRLHKRNFYIKHFLMHRDDFYYKCGLCGEGFFEYGPYESHLNIHSNITPYKCVKCKSKFTSRQGVLGHTRMKHKRKTRRECTVCKRMVSKFNFALHMKRHENADVKKHLCNYCGKFFKTSWQLKKHQLRHTGERPHVCEYCGDSFSVSVGLQTHMRRHTGERPFECNVCGKTFAFSTPYKYHLRTHTGERPFKCEYCGMTFAQPSPYAVHKRLHTGERPYKCKICPEAFPSHAAVRNHMRTHAVADDGKKRMKTKVAAKENEEPQQKKRRVRRKAIVEQESSDSEDEGTEGAPVIPLQPTRRSGRQTRCTKSLEEIGDDELNET